MEQAPWAGWIAAGLLGAGALAGSTVFLVGDADVAAVIGSVLVGVGGVGAAWRKWQLENLPLELADQVARGKAIAGLTLTARAWLGRGRRLEGISARATWIGDGEEQQLTVLVASGVVLGPFQLLIQDVPDGPGTLQLRLEVREGSKTWNSERRYDGERLVDGRFAPAVALQKGRIAWVRSNWHRIQHTPGTMGS